MMCMYGIFFFSELDLELLASMKSLQRLNLEGNPLTDDIKEFLESEENQFVVTF